MGAPYSLDLRERVVAAVGSGMSRRAAAKHYQVGVATAIRWTARAKRTGSPAALPMGGKKPFRAGRAGRLDPRPVGGQAGYYRTRAAGRTARAQGRGQLLRCVAFPRSRRPQL